MVLKLFHVKDPQNYMHFAADPPLKEYRSRNPQKQRFERTKVCFRKKYLKAYETIFGLNELTSKGESETPALSFPGGAVLRLSPSLCAAAHGDISLGLLTALLTRMMDEACPLGSITFVCGGVALEGMLCYNLTQSERLDK